MISASEQDSQRKEKIRDIQQRAKTLTDDVSELLDLYYRLAVVTATEKASNAAAVSITVIIILFLMMFMLLFAGIGIGWYLGERMNNMFAGYGIVALIFLVLVSITIAFRKTFLHNFIRNTIIKKVYE